MYAFDHEVLTTVALFPPLSVSFHFHARDRHFCEDLDSHLAPLRDNGRIQTWDERQILGGQGRDQESDRHLSTDRILILLLSADFLESKECQHQMKMALQRYRSGDATVIPILVRPCMWQETELKNLQLLPREQKALATLLREKAEEAWQEIANELIQVIRSIPRWVFVACAPEDRVIAERLHRDMFPLSVWLWSLEQEQLDSSLSQTNDEIRNAMRNTSIVLLLASPATADSSVVKTQMTLAAYYHLPILVVWIKGKDGEQPLAEDWQAEAILDAREERYENVRTALMERLKRQGKMAHAPEKEIRPLEEPRNPYKGLHAFTAEDVRDFFGREALVRELVTMLKQILSQDTPGKRPVRLLTVLLGASGSGKSSVVMAGLLPFLQQGGILDSRGWIYLNPMFPGKQPLEALAVELARHPSLGSVLTLHSALESDSLRTLHLLTRQLAGDASRKVVLFIDQFEEVFTLTASEQERQHFFDLLKTAVTEPQGSLLVLLTLRIDFYSRLAQYPDLYRLVDAHRVSVLPMEREDLRRVIEGPAQLPDVQITFEDGLVGDLLFEVREQSAPLPLLQFTLDQLFTRRKGRQLTLEAYREIGRVKGALAQHAEETYAALPSEEHRKLARILFIRLIDFGTTPQDQDMARRRAILAEFELSDSRLTPLLQETMNDFITARLLTANEVEGTVTVEVSHEALIRAWPRCGDWIQEAREVLPVQQTLSKDVAQWEQLGKPKDRLYRGSQVKAIKKKVDRNLLNKQEANFLSASEVYQQKQSIRMVALFLLPVIILALVVSPILVFRPSWCPSWLCPAPRLLISNAGIHDSNLQVTLQTFQSYMKVLPEDPSSYTLGNLPKTGDAQLIYTKQTIPYRVVLGIHSLQQGHYGLVIDQVTVIVNKLAQSIPYPLRVWVANDVSTFNNNLYRVTYRGQEINAALSALYMSQPSGFVSLLPGETDELTLEVRSAVVVDLHFQVQVTYHVIGELAAHLLTLPNIFEVIYSDPANWHPYQLGPDGRLVVAS